MKNSTNPLPPHIIGKNNGLIIVGAPRSGLSLLVNSLRLLGMGAGGQKAEIVTGPALIYQLFCQDLGLSPQMVGHLPEDWQYSTAVQEAKRRIRKLLIALEATDQPWMLADPYLCRVFPLWQEALEELDLKPKFIHLVRHPWETAQSLAHAEQIDLSTGHLIWLQCNREAIGIREEYPYMLATFDQLLADPVSLLANVKSTLSLDYPLDMRSVYQELLNLTHPGTNRFHANSATKKERAVFGPFLGVYNELRTLQADVSVRSSETIQPKWDMLDFVLGTIGQQQRDEYKQVASFSEQQKAVDLPDSSLQAQLFFPSFNNKGETVETIPLTTNEWQKISIQVPESNRTIKKRLKFSPMSTNGVFWMSAVKFVNRITGEELCSYQGGKDFNQFDLEGTLVRIYDPDNMLLLITGKSALLILPCIEHLPDCPLEIVLWVRATRDQTIVREHLIDNQQSQNTICSAEYLNRKGEALYFDEKFKEAAEFFNIASDLRPDSAKYCQNLAETIARLNYKEDPAWCCQNLAVDIEKHGKWDVAVRHYRKALKLDPVAVEAHWKAQTFKVDKAKDDQVENPVFIVGCGHSGTSLMLALLGNHYRFYPVPKESALFLHTDSQAQKIMAKWDAISQKQGKTRWIEKTPPHIFQIARFLELRPKSKFILMLRDGRDVVCSLKNRQGYSRFEDRLDRWIYDNMAGLPYWKHPQLMVVKYEDLVMEPEHVLKAICQFLGEDYKEQMLEFHKTKHLWYSDKIEKPEAIKSHNDHNNLRNWQINQPLFDGRGRWIAEMTIDEKRQFKNSAAQQYLVQFGYVNNRDW